MLGIFSNILGKRNARHNQSHPLSDETRAERLLQHEARKREELYKQLRMQQMFYQR